MNDATPGAPASPDVPEAAVERVAALILQATQQAAQSILDAATRAAREIATAATAVPTALSTPPAGAVDAEALVRAFEVMQANQGNGYGNQQGNPYTDGIDLPFDPTLDILVDSTGERWNPDPGGEPTVPSPDRQAFATVPPGTPIVPQLPRWDQ